MKFRVLVNDVTFVSFIILSSTCGSLLAQKSVYLHELKELKKRPVYQAILDRKAAHGPRYLATNIENVQKVGVMGRLFRLKVLLGNPLIVNKKSMPHLYEFVRTVCNQLAMPMPTICITKDKTNSFFGGSTLHSNSTKIFTDSGAILLGQDLVCDVSQKAVEAAVCFELARIKNNHQNKELFIKWILPIVINRTIPSRTLNQRILAKVVIFLLPRLILGKIFEREADKFVFDTMKNAEGLIELCSYWQKHEKKIDADYDEVYELLKKIDASLLDRLDNRASYIFMRTQHRVIKAIKWIARVAPLSGYQQYQDRIERAKGYLEA